MDKFGNRLLSCKFVCINSVFFLVCRLISFSFSVFPYVVSISNPFLRLYCQPTSLYKYYFFYMNTNEILGELLGENMKSSHVKIKSCLHTWGDHLCYCYLINRAFRSEIKRIWLFIGVYMIYRILHGRLEIRNLSSRAKKIFYSLATLTHVIFFYTGRNISYLRTAM